MTGGRAFLGSAKAAWWSFLSSSLGGRADILASRDKMAAYVTSRRLGDFLRLASLDGDAHNVRVASKYKGLAT